MSLLTVIITIVVVGVLLYLINRYVPMQSTIKKFLNIVVIILMAIWLLRVLGFWSYLKNISI